MADIISTIVVSAIGLYVAYSLIRAANFKEDKKDEI